MHVEEVFGDWDQETRSGQTPSRRSVSGQKAVHLHLVLTSGTGWYLRQYSQAKDIAFWVCDSPRSHSTSICCSLGRTFHIQCLLGHPELNYRSGTALCPDIAGSYPNFLIEHFHFQWPWNRKKVTWRETWRYGEIMQMTAPKFRGRAKQCGNSLLLYEEGISQRN